MKHLLCVKWKSLWIILRAMNLLWRRKISKICFLLTISGPFQYVSHLHSLTYANFHVSMYTSPKHLSEQGTLANAHQPQHVLIFTVGKFPPWNKDMHKGIKVRWGFVFVKTFPIPDETLCTSFSKVIQMRRHKYCFFSF